MYLLRYKLRRRQRPATAFASELRLDLGLKVRRLLMLLLALSAAHVVLMMWLEGLGFEDGLPQSLRDLGVVHRHDTPDHDEAWQVSNLAAARYLIILAHDHHDRRTDSLTFDIVHRAFEHLDPARTYVVAECVDDMNRPRLQSLGVSSVVRPIRAYPELVVRAIIAPGVERLMENLFTHRGDHLQRYDLDIHGVSWSGIVSTLVRRDWGTAMAYIASNGEVVCNPPARETIDARALLLLVRDGREPESGEMKTALSAIVEH